MKVVHLVLSNSFAGIEQHVNELLTNINNVDTILICNESIAKISIQTYLLLQLKILEEGLFW